MPSIRRHLGTELVSKTSCKCQDHRHLFDALMSLSETTLHRRLGGDEQSRTGLNRLYKERTLDPYQALGLHPGPFSLLHSSAWLKEVRNNVVKYRQIVMEMELLIRRCSATWGSTQPTIPFFYKSTSSNHNDSHRSRERRPAALRR